MERLVSYLNITRTHCPRQKNDPRGISEMLSQTMGAAAWARPAERGEGEAGSLSPAQPRGPRVRGAEPRRTVPKPRAWVLFAGSGSGLTWDPLGDPPLLRALAFALQFPAQHQAASRRSSWRTVRRSVVAERYVTTLCHPRTSPLRGGVTSSDVSTRRRGESAQ